jgi:hypothetical protein
MASTPAHADVPRKTKYNNGGGLVRLQSAQESAANRFRELGLCNYDARAAAEGRPLLCPDCIERMAQVGHVD